MFVNKRKETVRTKINNTFNIQIIHLNAKFSGNITANFRSSISALTLPEKFADFPSNSSAGGV